VLLSFKNYVKYSVDVVLVFLWMSYELMTYELIIIMILSYYDDYHGKYV